MKGLNKYIFILIHVLIFPLLIYCEYEFYSEEAVTEEIIDPHSFFYDKQSKSMVKDIQINAKSTIIKEDNIAQEETTTTATKQDNYISHELIFYKRLINLMLTNMNIKEENDVSIAGVLEIEMSHSQMETLKNFHLHKTSLREIDYILSTIIKKPRFEYTSMATNGLRLFQDICINIVEIIQENVSEIGIIFLVLITFWIMKNQIQSRRFSIFTLLHVIFVISFFMTWWQLIQESQIKTAAAQMKFTSIPISCQPEKMTIWDKFVSYFSQDDCEKYHEVMMSNSKFKVTPALALTHFITNIILHPIMHMGTVISVFIDNATARLSFLYAWMVKVILFLCIGIVILVIPFCISGAHINLGLGPLFRFSINSSRNDKKGNLLQSIEKREPVQIILKLQQDAILPQITNSSEYEQSQIEQILETQQEKSIIKNDDCSNRSTDLCYGDTMKNIVISKIDDGNVMVCKEVDSIKETKDVEIIEKRDGSGDA